MWLCSISFNLEEYIHSRYPRRPAKRLPGKQAVTGYKLETYIVSQKGILTVRIEPLAAIRSSIIRANCKASATTATRRGFCRPDVVACEATAAIIDAEITRVEANLFLCLAKMLSAANEGYS
jgi:hypothetical protein